MKLTICIPIYNTEASALVNALAVQINQQRLNDQVSIFVIDDASDLAYQELNESLSEICTYVQLAQNIGRSKIRNLFIEKTTSPYLLFLDGDSLIDIQQTPQFIANYLEEISVDRAIVCGGRVYPTTSDPNLQLSYLNGIHKESKAANLRMKAPNASFMTNNFMIKRQILIDFPFDESLTQYGHEDTLLGIQLLRAGISIHHIDNPVVNGHIETNKMFLEKSKLALENLHFIWNKSSADTRHLLSEQVRLLLMVKTLKKYNSTKVVKIAFRVFSKLIEHTLISGKINLKLFDFYKLGYYLTLR